jgi:hypothetical protein
MPLPKSEALTDDELRDRRLHDPQVRRTVERIQREFSDEGRPAADGVSAEELQDFLRDHG